MLSKVKENLILDHKEDDQLINRLIKSAIDYAEKYQHLDPGHYAVAPMAATTEQAVIMLASHFYESRDGSTAGYFGNNVPAAQQVWRSVNDLLRLSRNWSV